MQAPKLEHKRIFLIASENDELVAHCRAAIEEHISLATVFTAGDGAEALFKIDNVLPHVAIVDAKLSKMDGFEVTQRIIALNREHVVSVILMADIPSPEKYVNEVITRQVQFLPDYNDAQALALCLSRALNRISLDERSIYRLKFLAPQEVLFHQGEVATSVFFVKKGELEVTQSANGRDVIIGQVLKAEFVGEMAHFNGEPRSATVRAIYDCELIEIPSDALDTVLFSKPAWAKALFTTLSRRLKASNERIAKS